MEKVRISVVKVGQMFSKPLFTDRGQKLLGAGVTITESHLKALHRNSGVYVYAATDADDLVKAKIVEQPATTPA